MAVVNLDTVLLAAQSDLSVLLELEVSSLDEQDAQPGQVRTYANGRRRSVTRAGISRTINLTFDVVADRASLDLLRSWRGQVVLFRDPRGRKVWGVFYEIEIDENVAVDIAEVSLSLTELTVSEAV